MLGWALLADTVALYPLYALLFADTGLSWILPSPNMPTPQTALLYPGTGLFEATNLSDGRGTTKPFELIGAPYVDHRWAADLNEVLRRATDPGGFMGLVLTDQAWVNFKTFGLTAVTFLFFIANSRLFSRPALPRDGD